MKRLGRRDVEPMILSRCPICGDMIDYGMDFRDAESKEEYKISGLCQHCQDLTFTQEEIDEIE